MVMPRQKSPMATAATAKRNWVLIDLENQVVGRAASRVAEILRGKHRPTFVPHVDNGDFVVAVNASKVRFTGNKLKDKHYRRHSGYPGGLKDITAEKLLKKNPERIFREAVWGMLPKNRLSRQLIKKLKIYPGAEHPHTAQQPETIT